MTYKEKARKARKKVLQLIYKAGTSHIGSNLSCAEMLTVLFDHFDFKKDKFVAGKSWAAASVYYQLRRRGRITQKELDSFCQPGSKYLGLVEPGKDIPFGIGSMGFALSAACGFAWSKLQRKQKGTVYVLESDGGFHEGSTWEALMFAAHHKLKNLVCILDANRFSAMGPTRETLNQDYLACSLSSMGWDVDTVDGHDSKAIEAALLKTSNAPRLIIANTVKGKGVSRFEGNNLYHYKQLDYNEYAEAIAELGDPELYKKNLRALRKAI